MEYVTNTTLTNISATANETINNTINWKIEELTDMTHADLTRIVIDKALVPVLCVFGIIGNILSIVVLSRDDVMRKTTRFLLQNLAVADIGFLICSVFVISLDGWKYITIPFMLPIGSSFQTSTVYSVVIVTVDRYIAICHPLHSIKLSTMRNARWAVGVTWSIAIIFNIPRYFEYEYVYYSCGNSDGVEQICYRATLTSFGSTQMYETVYETFFYFAVRVCTPLLILIVCNVKLINAVRSSRARHDVTHTHQKNTTIMLVSIVIVFIVCITPVSMRRVCVLLSCVDMDIGNTLIHYTNLLLVINSSFNFIIYLLRGERFRSILLNMCKCQKVRVTDVHVI